MEVLITCEHGGNRVPAPWRALFRPHRALLDSHRGYDPGAIEVARTLAGAFGAPLIAAFVTRLLVDLNRSIGHPRLFSEVTRPLPEAARREILQVHYHPHRARVEGCVERALAGGGALLHVAAHSFTPVLNGVHRRAEVGLLYDPARAAEARLAARWQAALATAAPALVVRRNQPYRGTSDGLCTALRAHHPGRGYLGIELEVNQANLAARGAAVLRRTLARALTLALTGFVAGDPAAMRIGPSARKPGR